VNRDLYLGIDTGGTAMKYVLLAPSGSVVASGQVATEPADPVVSLQSLASAVSETLGGKQMPRLAAVGLACAGIIDPQAATVGRSPNLPGWQHRQLGQILGEVFGEIPQAVANDVNGALYGEYRHGAGQGCQNLIMLALGTGVGGGVIVDGELLVGSHCGAGEIGHMVLDIDGPPCVCGNRGCLEAYASSTGILRVAQKHVQGGRLAALAEQRGAKLTTADLARLAESGDAETIAVFAAAGRRLGQAIGSLVNVLDPDKVIIGGGVARAGALILAPCAEVIPQMVLSLEAQRVPLVLAELGNNAAAVGVASMARDKETSG